MQQNEFCILENNCSINIRSIAHFDNHLDNLLRTDDEQRWTNGQTPDNCIGLASDNKIYLCGDIKSRNMLKNYVKEDVEQFFFDTFGNVDFNEFYPRYLFSFCLYRYDHYENGLVSISDFNDFNPNLVLKKFDDHMLANLFALVFHQDQIDPVHMHGLFFFDNPNYESVWDRIFDVLNYIAII